MLPKSGMEESSDGDEEGGVEGDQVGRPPPTRSGRRRSTPSPAPAPSPTGGRVSSPPFSRSTLMLVFFSGALVALSAHLLSWYLRSLRDRPPEADPLSSSPSHSEAAGHLLAVEESATEGFHSSSSRQLKRQRPTQVAAYRDCEAETLKTLSAAQRTARRQKAAEKARKLPEHAVSLCPKHPKILVSFGEFLEQTEGDLMEADHVFTRAMRFSEVGSEEHAMVLMHKRRTAGRVEELDRRVFRRLDDKKKLFQKMNEANASAMKRAKKEAYFHHIFHTVGIEGNTLSLSQTRFILETQLAIGGRSIHEHNEVIGLDAALRYVNQTLVDRVGLVTLGDVLEIHRRVMGHVDPVMAAMVRHTQVWVSNHVPPHPSDIDFLLHNFFAWLNNPERSALHPVQLAALAHYKFVYIHPFEDGNGRTSRLLMNVILMQSGFPPVIVRKQDRHEYFRHLASANEGDARPFVRFIAACTERTLDAFLAAGAENPSSGSNSLAALMAFADESETTISAEDRLEYHNAIIMGGAVGENVTVKP